MAIWGSLGALSLIFHNLLTFIIFIIIFYALWYGTVEVWGLPFQPPSSTWQVPANWLLGSSFMKRSMVWGVTLGPGLITRNPYAGMWLLLWLVIFSQDIFLGSLVGLTHGMARAFGILKNLNYITAKFDHTGILVTQGQWRMLDGVLLLTIAGFLIGFL